MPDFYVKTTPESEHPADIVFNGNTISNPLDLAAILENQVGKSLHEVGSFDAHVLNTNYNIGLDDKDLAPRKDGSKISIMVMVSGNVTYYKDGQEGEVRSFSDSVLLVPNMEAQSPKAAKGLKKWLVQSQCFRLVL